MTEDSKKLVRTAQDFIVEIRRGSGSPPSFGSWQVLWGAKVDRIEINHGGAPSVATIWFPEWRWHEPLDWNAGDNIRIGTDAGTVIFMGFITSFLPSFSGGTESTRAFERNAFVALSYRWLLATTSPIYGQFARGIDDYDADNGAPLADGVTFLSGQRAIFNPDGRPNRDAVLFQGAGPEGSGCDNCEIPLFIDPAIIESSSVKYWTAKHMLQYVSSPSYNLIHKYWPLSDPDQVLGLDEDDPDYKDWDKILNHIVVEGLNVLEAITLICKHLGWSFKEHYELDKTPKLIFYKVGAISSTGSGWITLHSLYAPAVDETIDDAVARGEKLLWSMDVAKEITSVINKPWGLGAPHRFEFTAELVPAWLDADLVPDTSQENANLFFTESELQKFTDKNSKNYFKYYHPRGIAFRRNVGRRWALNESGRYTNADTYNRGPSFNFADNPESPAGRCGRIPDEYIVDKKSDPPKRLFAPYRRQLLNCLTKDKDSDNSIGIVVEFCFNGLANPADRIWQVIPASISSLKDECGFYIDEVNLAELVDKAEGTIIKEEEEEGALEGVQLNYWSSLCDDKLNARLYFDEEGLCKWKTRVRVTASVQMDQRLMHVSAPSSASGSPFLQSQIYDFSAKYGLLKRTASSKFAPAVPPTVPPAEPVPVYEMDSTDFFSKHLDAIRRTNEDKSISGQFTLERMWLGSKDSPQPEFAVGDCIEKITGREYDLSAVIAGEGKDDIKVYPEIIQIIYLPDQQKEKLITRDLRFAEVLL
ncbi:MAG: hypothetical protein MUP16_09990 [Sedimentisphaerales bacterium]|nr:hypothetical protein [Sedimentisphaerales bacterium]